MDTDDAIEALWKLVAEVKYHGLVLEKSPLPLGPHLDLIKSFGEELELLAAGFQGEQRYSVTLHYPAVTAENKDEAILKAYRSDCNDGHAIEVDGEDFPPDQWFK